jgi:hypothetical protein
MSAPSQVHKLEREKNQSLAQRHTKEEERSKRAKKVNRKQLIKAAGISFIKQ